MVAIGCLLHLVGAADSWSRPDGPAADHFGKDHKIPIICQSQGEWKWECLTPQEHKVGG